MFATNWCGELAILWFLQSDFETENKINHLRWGGEQKLRNWKKGGQFRLAAFNYCNSPKYDCLVNSMSFHNVSTRAEHKFSISYGLQMFYFWVLGRIFPAIYTIPSKLLGQNNDSTIFNLFCLLDYTQQCFTDSSYAPRKNPHIWTPGCKSSGLRCTGTVCSPDFIILGSFHYCWSELNRDTCIGVLWPQRRHVLNILTFAVDQIIPNHKICFSIPRPIQSMLLVRCMQDTNSNNRKNIKA